MIIINQGINDRSSSLIVRILFANFRYCYFRRVFTCEGIFDWDSKRIYEMPGRKRVEEIGAIFCTMYRRKIPPVVIFIF